MKISKKGVDMVFIVVSAIFLILLIKFNLIEKYIGLGLIPLLIAYQIGKYAERKFKD
jgi:hypothetical protein